MHSQEKMALRKGSDLVHCYESRCKIQTEPLDSIFFLSVLKECIVRN